MVWGAAFGVAQAGIGIWQEIKASKDQEAAVDKIKPATVPDELYQNKSLVKGIYSDIGSEKTQQEVQIKDLGVKRRLTNASVGLSPGARMQADIASNVEEGSMLNEVYGNYRKAYQDLVKTEMDTNRDIAGAKTQVYSQNLQVAGMKQDMYNRRQEAWGELINAGISNVAGAIQSRQNALDLNTAMNPEMGTELKTKAEEFFKTNTNPQAQEDYKTIQKAIANGNYDRAQRLMRSYNIY